MVYCFASICTGKPSSCNVAEVTGPIEANWMLSIHVWCRPPHPRDRRSRTDAWSELPPSSATKLRTVEELVNVITLGRRELLSAACSREREDRGTTVW